MKKMIKKAGFWVRRRSHLPLFLLGGVAILVLFFNEETSLKLNMQYQREIQELRSEIKLCNDSAKYYRQKRLAIEHGTDDLEHVAREQFHMQRPSEDVFVVE